MCRDDLLLEAKKKAIYVNGWPIQSVTRRHCASQANKLLRSHSTANSCHVVQLPGLQTHKGLHRLISVPSLNSSKQA